MSEEITKKAREIYDNLMYFPYKVLDIFNDFFGEDRVDLQGFITFEEFISILEQRKLAWFFPNKASVYNTAEFKALPKEGKDMVVTLLDNDALSVPVLSDNAVATYILPLMTTILANTMVRDGCVLVHFPNVRVTNENNRFVDINHLWVKVGIKLGGAGTGFFTVNRSEYQLSHMQADYLHSHVSGIPFDDFTRFKSPCLGSGPIKNTLATLAIGYDEAMWQLFCLELDKYVRVESISGVPYRHLEKISNREGMTIGASTFTMKAPYNKYTSRFTKDNMKDFVVYLIEKGKLRFNFINGNYGLAMSYIDYMILISNEFIEWYNHRFNQHIVTSSYAQLKSDKVLKECIIDNGKIFYFTGNTASNRDYLSYEGRGVCMFKGEPVNIHIVDDNRGPENKVVLVNSEIAETIVKAILETVNYKYGRKEEREEAGASSPTDYL